MANGLITDKLALLNASDAAADLLDLGAPAPWTLVIMLTYHEDQIRAGLFMFKSMNRTPNLVDYMMAADRGPHGLADLHAQVGGDTEECVDVRYFLGPKTPEDFTGSRITLWSPFVVEVFTLAEKARRSFTACDIEVIAPRLGFHQRFRHQTLAARGAAIITEHVPDILGLFDRKFEYNPWLKQISRIAGDKALKVT